jgi:hypothetical protein
MDRVSRESMLIASVVRWGRGAENRGNRLKAGHQRAASRPSDARASGWKRGEHGNVCRSSTQLLALFGYYGARSASGLRRRVGAGDCSPEPLTEPDWWTTHPALHADISQTTAIA